MHKETKVKGRIERAAKAISTHRMRMALFHAKRSVGASTRGEQPFLVNELSRLLEIGRISKDLHIMADGRVDGAGAQGMAKMSALALARYYGLNYVHAPFRTMEHPENTSPTLWAASWERIFNIGQSELTVEECSLPHVAIEDFITDRSWWDRPCVLIAGHYTRFTDQHPVAYAHILQEMRNKYCRNIPPRRERHEIIVCAHLRRGDVNPLNPQTLHRTANLAGFADCLQQVHEALARTGLRIRTKVFSQGDAKGLEMLLAMGCELYLDTPAIDSFHQLADADVLIMGRSSFSFTAALLCGGMCIYDSFARTPLPGWLTRNSNGLVDAGALATNVAAIFRTSDESNVNASLGKAQKIIETPSIHRRRHELGLSNRRKTTPSLEFTTTLRDTLQ